jgi:phospholipase/carboxylesterase
MDGFNVMTQPPQSGGAPRSLVVMLHGVGSNGADLIGLAPYLAPGLPHTEFVSPDACEPYDMAPVGYQWFSLADRTPAELMREVRRTAPKVQALLDQLLAERGLDDSRLALLGFSQGTMMSLHVGLRRRHAPAALVGFSGALLAGPELLQEVTSRPPTLLIHGTEDEVVSPQSLPMSEAALRAVGVRVETLSCPGLGHSIDEAGIARARAFLERALVAAPAS